MDGIRDLAGVGGPRVALALVPFLNRSPQVLYIRPDRRGRRRSPAERDYERLPAHHCAWVYLAAIFQMTRRLAEARQDAPDPDQGLKTGTFLDGQL
jgi:hypothetical protein